MPSCPLPVVPWGCTGCGLCLCCAQLSSPLRARSWVRDGCCGWLLGCCRNEALVAVEKAKSEALAEGKRQAEAAFTAQLASRRAAWESELQRERLAMEAARDEAASRHEVELSSMRVMAASLQREALASQHRAADLEVRRARCGLATGQPRVIHTGGLALSGHPSFHARAHRAIVHTVG